MNIEDAVAVAAHVDFGASTEVCACDAMKASVRLNM